MRKKSDLPKFTMIDGRKWILDPYGFGTYSPYYTPEEQEKNARLRVEKYVPLDRMSTSCLSRAFYAEPGFDKDAFLERLKKGIEDLHRPLPKALIFTLTTAANRSFLIKEAFKTAYPDEKMPVFLTLNIKPARFNTPEKKAEAIRSLTKLMQKKFSAYGISGGEVVVVDEFAIQRDGPWKPGYGSYDRAEPDSSLAIAASIVERAVDYAGLGIRVDTYNFMPLSQWNPNIANGPWIKYSEHSDYKHNHSRARSAEEVEISRANINYLKEVGKQIGTEIREANDKKKKLEQMVSGVVAAGGVFGSIYFLDSGVTGNAIVSMSAQNPSFLAAGLLIVGLFAGLFWVNTHKK